MEVFRASFFFCISKKLEKILCCFREVGEEGESNVSLGISHNEKGNCADITTIVSSSKVWDPKDFSLTFTVFILLNTLNVDPCNSDPTCDTLSLGPFSYFSTILGFSSVVWLEIGSSISCNVFSIHSSLLEKCSILGLFTCIYGVESEQLSLTRLLLMDFMTK